MLAIEEGKILKEQLSRYYRYEKNNGYHNYEKSKKLLKENMFFKKIKK